MTRIDRRCGWPLICLGVVLASAGPAGAQTQEQIDWCVNEPRRFSPDLAISGCTAAIQSGKWSGKGLAWAFANRGIAYVTLKDLNRALVEYNTALSLDPEYAVGYYNRGTCYFRLNDDDRAIADLSQAIRFRPNYAAAYANRALAYERKGDRERAIADFRLALQYGDKEAADDLRRLGVTP